MRGGILRLLRRRPRAAPRAARAPAARAAADCAPRVVVSLRYNRSVLVRKLLAVALIASALATHGSANCEVGGYAIHTTATYKELDPKRVFLQYHVTDTGDIEVVTADSEGTLR